MHTNTHMKVHVPKNLHSGEFPWDGINDFDWTIVVSLQVKGCTIDLTLNGNISSFLFCGKEIPSDFITCGGKFSLMTIMVAFRNLRNHHNFSVDSNENFQGELFCNESCAWMSFF
jgi:hypothetical protein